MARISKLNNVFNKIELNYATLTNQINNWLRYTYKKSAILFNASSPYGQILEVVKELFVHNILYLKNFVRNIDIEQANSISTIRSIARISGHNPSRPMCAKGTLNFKLLQGKDISSNFSNKTLVIYNDTVIRNNTNGLFYTLKTGALKNYYNLMDGRSNQFFINVIQGKYETQTFTGDGSPSQSFQVSTNGNVYIDNFDVQVYLNGINLEIKDHLYDIFENEYSCYTRTGFNGGLDIYFGNGKNGVIPPIGSIIEVKYLMTNGTAGNILNNKINDFTFIDNAYDSDGEVVKIEKFFDIFIETDIKFAGDGESVEYTKSVIPYVSRNFVLSTPPQFIYHLRKLNMFSKVHAFNTLNMIKVDYDSDGVEDNVDINDIYLYLIPRITDYFSTNVNYFNVKLDAFYLDPEEKERILIFLKQQGTIGIISNVKIIDPKLKFFVINIFIRRFSDVPEDNIRENIVTILSDFFSTYERHDRIVKADIISELKTLDGIDSVNIEFVGLDNENYHKNGSILSSNQRTVIETTSVSSNGESLVVYKDTNQYDPKKMIGIDPVLGDIIINNGELVILRGGWHNRNGVYFNDDPISSNGLSSINIIWKDTTDRY